MTLKELGEQYLSQEQKIRKRIKELREFQKSLAHPDRDLEARIFDLYTTAINLRSTGEYLINYYSKKNHVA